MVKNGFKLINFARKKKDFVLPVARHTHRWRREGRTEKFMRVKDVLF